MYRWDVGRCVGESVGCNKDAFSKVRHQTISVSSMKLMIRTQSMLASLPKQVPHENNQDTGDADYNNWVLLEV